MSDSKRQFSEEEIEETICFFKNEFGKLISISEAKEFLQEIEEMENYSRESADYNFQMQKIEDAMWREASNGLIQNGIKPLMTF